MSPEQLSEVWTTESRIAHRLDDDPPPEGWRRCISWFRDDGTLDWLFTSAPDGTSPYDDRYEHRFVKYRQIRETRKVTAWSEETRS